MFEWSRSVGKVTRWASESILISESFIHKRSPLSVEIKTLGKQPNEIHSTSAVVRLSWFVASCRISFRYLMKVYLLVWMLLSFLFVWFIWLLWCGSYNFSCFPFFLLLFVSLSRWSGLVCLSYLVRFIWLLWIGSFYNTQYDIFDCKWAVTRWQWLICMYINM